MMKTSESVSPRHPDKLCDRISDAILDAYLTKDPQARVAVETLGAHGTITVAGEVSADAEMPDVHRIVRTIAGPGFDVRIHIVEQSPEISRGVDTGGAGDQGIMTGYATAETATYMPREYELARTLCQAIYALHPYDGKTQVTIADDGSVRSVVASFQNVSQRELKKIAKKIVPADEYHLNPAGDWSVGGFDADTGLTGRKIVVDNYGPEIAVGGGAFSGKDPSKVDRSGAYMARRIAVDLLKKRGARTVFVKLAYAIGHPSALMAVATLDGNSEPIRGYDLTPRGIRIFLSLNKPRYEETAQWGHFGRGFPWL
ncbi:MAG: methionine adenosyltransferase domain-containing protein [Patescibacteria group bacterium]